MCVWYTEVCELNFHIQVCMFLWVHLWISQLCGAKFSCNVEQLRNSCFWLLLFGFHQLFECCWTLSSISVMFLASGRGWWLSFLMQHSHPSSQTIICLHISWTFMKPTALPFAAHANKDILQFLSLENSQPVKSLVKANIDSNFMSCYKPGMFFLLTQLYSQTWHSQAFRFTSLMI